MTEPAPPSGEQVAAYRAGRDAFLAGETGLDCPYLPEDPGGLRRLWVRGFVQTRRRAGQGPPQLPSEDAGG